MKTHLPNILFLTLFLITAIPGLASEDFQIYKKGRSSWYKEDWQTAAENFKTLWEEYPESRFRCQSAYYLGYCYYKLDRQSEAFETLTALVGTPNCRKETIDDAKAKRFLIAFEFARKDDSYKKVLEAGLEDANKHLRLIAGGYLSELDDDSGLPVFFDFVENEPDRDLRDTAVKHILKIGSKDDKDRLEEILERQRKEASSGKPKMIRLIIRDTGSNQESVKINLPINLFNVMLKSLSQDQLDLIERDAGINLRKLDNFSLENLPPGHVLFTVIDPSGQEIKVFLE